ncbi:unnamed protein product [Effrenium voratum]|nr:unnamed protein product [Effrenium voratum]
MSWMLAERKELPHCVVTGVDGQQLDELNSLSEMGVRDWDSIDAIVQPVEAVAAELQDFFFRPAFQAPWILERFRFFAAPSCDLFARPAASARGVLLLHSRGWQVREICREARRSKNHVFLLRSSQPLAELQDGGQNVQIDELDLLVSVLKKRSAEPRKIQEV